MRTADFIKEHCMGTFCPDFDFELGCRAFDGEECDEAFCHPEWRGMRMADRVTRLCERMKDYGAHRRRADANRKRK